jgi:4-hydroxybenzoate polyprenyltransferase
MNEKAKKQERKTRKTLIINAVGFSVILLLGFEESNLLVNIFISLFVLANFLLYFFGKKLKKNIYFQVNLLAVLVAFVTAYDYYSKDSHYVWMIWLVLGCVYIVLAFIRRGKEKK